MVKKEVRRVVRGEVRREVRGEVRRKEEAFHATCSLEMVVAREGIAVWAGHRDDRLAKVFILSVARYHVIGAYVVKV